MENDRVRIDKWLWAVRVFKTREAASDMCERGKVSSGGQRVKPSRGVSPGMKLEVRKDGIDRVFEVVKCIDKRVGAKEAAECFKDLTRPEEIEKARIVRSMNVARPFREKGAGRPTKKDRRDMGKYLSGR